MCADLIGRAREPEDYGDAGVTEDGGETEGKEEPVAVKWVEGHRSVVKVV